MKQDTTDNRNSEREYNIYIAEHQTYIIDE